MGILRKTVQREIFDILDNSVFTSDDFDVKFGDHENGESILKIVFKFSDNFSYMINKEEESPFGGEIFVVNKSPGELEDSEINKYKSLRDAFEYIELWCEEIRHELKAVQPIYEEVENLRKIIFDHIYGNENDEFSVKEIYEIRENFHALSKRVEQLEKEKIITDKQLEEFKNGLSQVTDDLEHYPKKTWVNTATNKLVNIITSIGRSKEGRQVLAEGAKKLLGME